MKWYDHVGVFLLVLLSIIDLMLLTVGELQVIFSHLHIQPEPPQYEGGTWEK